MEAALAKADAANSAAGQTLEQAPTVAKETAADTAPEASTAGSEAESSKGKAHEALVSTVG